jgi:hypothetical protein
MEARDLARWRVDWTLEKRHGDIGDFRARVGSEFATLAQAEAAFLASEDPYEIRHVPGNLLVNAGIQLMEDLLIGAGGTAYTNAVSAIGVGTSSTGAAAGQTNLQGGAGAAFRKAMDSTYPSRASQTLSFRSSFATGEANFAWNEWGIFNSVGTGDPPTGGTMLNRKVESLGTKATGTWTLTGTVAIS